MILRWLKKRKERKTFAVAMALLQNIKDHGEEWLFPDQLSPWAEMAIDRGWIERTSGYVRSRSDGPAPYRLTEAGIAVLKEQKP